MRIVDGSIDDVLENIYLISTAIPAKSGITEAEIRKKLGDNNHGVKIALDNEELVGLSVWYEEDNSLYLWLGAYKVSGQGIGSKVLSEILAEMPYERSFVKIGEDNIIAKKHLEKFGFQEYKKESEIIYLEYGGEIK